LLLPPQAVSPPFPEQNYIMRVLKTQFSRNAENRLKFSFLPEQREHVILPAIGFTPDDFLLNTGEA
jgi:hypothetical protein